MRIMRVILRIAIAINVFILMFPLFADIAHTQTIHDIAVSSVYNYPSIVMAGQPVNVSILVWNQGDFTEINVHVMVFADTDTTIIGDEILIGDYFIPSLDPYFADDRVVVWDTTGVTSATYTVSAAAQPVPGEGDLDNNLYVDGPVIIYFPFWKAPYPDYAPSGVPDFDQRQDAWTNGAGAWTHCGPVAVGNSLWWMDSRFEPGNTSPPAISDGFRLVESYSPLWDDHDPQNVQPFIQDLAWYMDTNGIRTGIPHSGTDVFDMEKGIRDYLFDKGLDMEFYEKTVKMPTFEYIANETLMSEDVILLLGFWQEQYEPTPHWVRVGGHFVTVAGVDIQNMLVGFSDPIQDNAENGNPGRVLPFPHLPGHTSATHNDAQFISHDMFAAGPTNSPGGIWGPANYAENYTVISNFFGENTPSDLQPYAGDFNLTGGSHIQTEVEYAVSISPSPWFWKARFPDYAPSGMPDFDQRQDAWVNGLGAWTHCGPAAEANSLWWFDSKYEPGTMPPPFISDGFPLVESYNPLIWDDHDPQNVQPFIQDLAWYMDTNGIRTGAILSGTNVMDMQFGIIWYMKTKGLIPLGDANGDGIVNTVDLDLVAAAFGWVGPPNSSRWEDLDHDGDVDMWDIAIVRNDMGRQGKFIERTLPMPTFDFVEREVERSEDVVLLLGFWQMNIYGDWVRVGGHFVTVAGVYSANMTIAFSDPARDNAEMGGIGHVAPPVPPPHGHAGPPEMIHNDAGYLSHDEFTMMPLPPPFPGANWGPLGYADIAFASNFQGQNIPDSLLPFSGTLDPAFPIVTAVEYAVTVSPRGPIVYAGSQNNNVYALDSEGSLLWSFNTGAPVVSVATSLDGRYVAVGSLANRLYLLSAGGPQLWNRVIPVAYGGLGVGTESDTVGISADGQYVAAAATDGLYLYDVNGTLRWVYPGSFRLAQISADGNYITAISTGTGEVYLFNRAPPMGPLWIRSVSADWASIDALGENLAVSTNSNVILYDINGTEVWNYGLPKPGNTHVDISWDGRTVVSVNDDPSDSLGAELNYFSDMKDGSSGWSAADGTPLWMFQPSPASPNDDFYTVDTSKYGKVTATGGAPTNIYALQEDGMLLQNLTEPMAQVITVDLTFTGQYGATGDNIGVVWFFSKDSNATLWNFNAGLAINSVAIAEFYPCMIPFPNHDVAVIGVTPNATTAVQGSIVGITVTVQNQGDFAEPFDVSVELFAFLTETLTYKASITLTSGESATMSFTWNTAGSALGNYTIRAVATPVQDEIDIYDNTFTDGNVQVIGASGHDVAVVGIQTSKTIVGKGYFMNFSITVANQGQFSDTFNVTAYYNETAMTLYGGSNYTTVTLGNGTSMTLNLLWNTTGASMGNYTITAYAWPVPGETNTTNNSLPDGWVYVGVPCDITGPTPKVPDGICNMRDIGYIANKFGTTPSSPNWDPNADVTGAVPGVPDGIVNMRDIGEAARNFGKTDP